MVKKKEQKLLVVSMYFIFKEFCESRHALSGTDFPVWVGNDAMVDGCKQSSVFTASLAFLCFRKQWLYVNKLEK